MASKSKRCQISIDAKCKILEEIDKNRVPKSEVARMFGIKKSTLFTILKYRDKFLAANDSGILKDRIRARDGKFPLLEKALVEWLQQMRSENITIDANFLKQEAKNVAEKMNIKVDFKASHGWFEKFKDRHGLAVKKQCGERTVVKVSSVKRKEQLEEKCQPNDIVDDDEPGLHFKPFPERKLLEEKVRPVGFKSTSSSRISSEHFTNDSLVPSNSRNDSEANSSDGANKEDTVCSHSDDRLKQQQEVEEAASSNPTEDSSAGPSNVKPPYVLKESKMFVNVAFFVKSLQNLNNHGGDGCNFSNMYISGETNNDWNVGIELSCTMCLTAAVVWTQDPGPDLKKQRPNKTPTSARARKAKTRVTSEKVLSTPKGRLKEQKKTNSKKVPAKKRRVNKRTTPAPPPDPPVQQHFMLPPPLARPLQVPQSNSFHQEWPGNHSYLMNPHSSMPQSNSFPHSPLHSINPYIMVPQSNSIHHNLTDSPLSSINSHFINQVPFFKQEIGALEDCDNPFLNRVPLSSTQPASVQLLFSEENSNDIPLSLDENAASIPGAAFRNHQTSSVIGLKTSQSMSTSANETIVPEVTPNEVLPVDLNLVKAEIEEESQSMEVNNMPSVRIVPMSETSINR